MNGKRRALIGFFYGFIVNIFTCILLHILVISFYGGLQFGLTNFDFKILSWAFMISIFPTLVCFSWFGYKLGKKEFIKKRIWGYSFISGFIVIFFAASIGNGIFHLLDNNLNHIGFYLKTVFVEMLKWAPIYSVALLPISVLLCTFALIVLSKIINFVSNRTDTIYKF